MTPQPTSTTDPTANWKTYTYNNGTPSPFGYSIKYPPEWKISTLKDTGADLGILDLLSPGKSVAHISAEPLKPNGFTFNDIVDNDKSYLSNSKQEEIMLSSGKATQITGIMNDRNHPDDIGKFWQAVYFENNNIVYRIFFLQPSDEGYLKTFGQILSTFRFLD